MSRICLIALAALLLIAPITAAQESPQYRLRVPTAEEFLTAAPSIAHQAYEESETGYIAIHPRIMSIELEWRYSDDGLFAQPFDLLYEAAIALELETMGSPADPEIWGQNLLLAWLRDNPTDLSTVDELPYGTVTPVDFNGDGKNEYILDLFIGLGFHQPVVLQRDATEPGRYRLVESPLGWTEMTWQPHQSPEGGYIHTTDLRDINGDGLPEWLVTHDGWGYWADCGQVFVLAWHDGQLVDLADGGLSDCWTALNRPEWEFTESGGALEIRQENSWVNNWGCVEEDIRFLDWIGSEYVLVNEVFQHGHSFGCVLTEAETATREGRYADAIPGYEEAIPLAGEYEQEQRQYAQARLAVAHALTGQVEAAVEVLTEAEPSGMMGELLQDIEGAYVGPGDTFALCAAAYNFFELHNNDRLLAEAAGDYYNPYPFIFHEYRESESSVIRVRGHPLPDPAESGCDAPAMIAEVLTSQRFGTGLPPMALLEQAGIHVAETMHADFNGDGQDDWLIWTMARTAQPFFFLSDGPVFRISQPYIGDSYTPYPGAERQVAIWRLPNGEGMGIASAEGYATRDDLTCRMQTSLCACPAWNAGPLAWLNLWRFENGDFVQASGTIPFCEWPGMEGFFTDGVGPQSFIAYQPEGTWLTSEPAPYVWDRDQGQYLFQPPSSVPAQPTPITSTASGLDYWGLGRALGNPEYAQEALQTLDDDRRETGEGDPSEENRYWRALLLEALDRPEEALAEYVALYEAAPESSWGMLAALHLELVEEE